MLTVWPIAGIDLSPHPQRSLSVERVTFVDRMHLIRNPKDFHITDPLFEAEPERLEALFFPDAPTVAILRHTALPPLTPPESYRRIQDELAIVSFTRLTVQRR